jgi:hypothetical protein
MSLTLGDFDYVLMLGVPLNLWQVLTSFAGEASGAGLPDFQKLCLMKKTLAKLIIYQ